MKVLCAANFLTGMCYLPCAPGRSLRRLQELFQLIMRELFDADFGMFIMDPVSRTYYFQASPK